MEPPTQPGGNYTSTPTGNHELGSPGRQGHIADGSDTGRMKQDSTRTKPKSRKPLPLQAGRPMTELPPYVALNQSTSIIDTEEWPQLPGPGAQDLHGPNLQPRAMPRVSSAGNPMAPPTAIYQQEQKLQETAMDSTEQDTISSEEIGKVNLGVAIPITSDTVTNVPEAGQSTTETPTSTRRQRAARSQRPNSSTACFSYDTFVLVLSQGYALWKKFYKVTKGE